MEELNRGMTIKLNNGITITIDDDKLVSWSHDRFTGIYTVNMSDGSTWKYESKIKSFYKLL